MALLESPYTHRGSSQEYDRVFINMILHMTDFRSNKKGASLSTSIILYAQKRDDQSRIPFVNDSKILKARLHIVSVPKKILVQNNYNTYLNQNEFVTSKGHFQGAFNFLLNWNLDILDSVASLVRFKKSFDKSISSGPPTNDTLTSESFDQASTFMEEYLIISNTSNPTIADPNI